jgi:mannitol-1-phosphate/altronate dehydrogenase
MNKCIKSLQSARFILERGVINDSEGDDQPCVMDNMMQIKTIITYARPYEICLLYEDVGEEAPVSVPAKLLLILHDRFLQTEHKHQPGINIVTPFLLSMYIDRLEAYVIELVHLSSFEPHFIDWIERENRFSNYMIN